MLYRDLVQFTPIERVIQLRDADEASAAKTLVQSFVISNTMANKLVDVVFPELQFEIPHDNKGVLIIGNYGTGKSHLMSVISSLAEHANLVEDLTNDKVKDNSQNIAGKFKVIRVEIGSVTKGLREILLDELQSALTAWGVPFTFPSASQITNNKTAIIQAVAAFQEKYPGKGILLVVDELLDYFRTREHRALILDLGFLRELGEVAATCHFRFIGGLQETLFENPRFSFVAEQLRRVKDRFEQINIAREDISYVVSQRLLKKTETQKAQIAEHLRKRASFYKTMSEQMDLFVELFPIHPAYIETFENLAIAEKREVLKTFSKAINSILDLEVPTDQTGLISYDHYWKLIQDDPGLRAIDEISRVIEKSNILEGLIQNAYTRPNLKDMAIRIIRALSVQRLSTNDINVPIGVTAEGLRDGLCLYQRLPPENNTAEFLLDQVHVALGEIIRTVQGQFIAHNQENGQYYLDLNRVIDFDQKIQERGDFMDKQDLNVFFYDAMRQVLNLSDTTYLTGYSIWFYELPWQKHKVTRPGYLFFGLPDERTTAQPERDFYIYFLPPFSNRNYNDQKLPDEAHFYLTELDQDFEDIIRTYAGARSMANESTEYRTEYSNKAEAAFRRLTKWLQEHMVSKLHVIYEGVDNPIQTVLTRLRSTASQNIEELIRMVSSHLFALEFEESYPDYPVFDRLSQLVTEASRENSAMEAIRSLCGRSSYLGAGVLEGLGLMDAQGKIRPYDSNFASFFLETLNEKPEGQVINRNEVIQTIETGLVLVEKDIKFQLEPEWVAVILLSLVYSGDIVLSLDGREELDSGSLERALTRSIKDLSNFRFYKRPRSLPVSVWTMIFEGLGLQPGLIRDENTRETAVTELQRIVNLELEKVVKLQNQLEKGPKLWNTPVLTDNYTFVVEQGTVVGSDAPEFPLSLSDLIAGLRGYKQFLEELTKFTTVGKLRNLRITQVDVNHYLDDHKVVMRTQELLNTIDQLQPFTTYLAEAQANLPQDHEWTQQASKAQKHTLDEIRKFGKGQSKFDLQKLVNELSDLKQSYIKVYTELHRKSVLSAKSDDLRQRLKKDPRYKTMEELSRIELLTHSGDFEFWKGQLNGLVSCRNYYETAITDSPTCPFCHLRPAQKTGVSNADVLIQQLSERLSDLLSNWRQALRDNLNSETAQQSLKVMGPTERKPVEDFLKQDDKSETIPTGFVSTALKALKGIQAITLPVDELLLALKNGGLPCAPSELKSRFNTFVEHQMKGLDPANTRLTLDQ